MSAPATPVVLVVDDDLDVLDTMSHQLGVRGFRVLTAPDTESALTMCEQQGGAVDVLIADLSLPGDLNGSLARRVSAAYPDVKIVYATGVPRHIALATGLVSATAPYLEKPVNADVLSGLMRNMIRR